MTAAQLENLMAELRKLNATMLRVEQLLRPPLQQPPTFVVPTSQPYPPYPGSPNITYAGGAPK